jgi:hypothetical protein
MGVLMRFNILASYLSQEKAAKVRKQMLNPDGCIGPDRPGLDEKVIKALPSHQELCTNNVSMTTVRLKEPWVTDGLKHETHRGYKTEQAFLVMSEALNAFPLRQGQVRAKRFAISYELMLCMRIRAVREGTTLANLLTAEYLDVVAPTAAAGPLQLAEERSRKYTGIYPVQKTVAETVFNARWLIKTLHALPNNESAYLRKRINCSVVASINNWEEGLNRRNEMFIE